MNTDCEPQQDVGLIQKRRSFMTMYQKVVKNYVNCYRCSAS